ncbi:MAG: hypothetical protein MJH09_07085 [Cetobacterium sp.]|uniref:Uncharacterized protein n=1 Tax=Cetobacterium ceti TaxID=180163 RepID=A0A1T4KZ67_9FUSO|nr:hypothetical protein [Cetobacterium ceti]MCJ8342597.1 hypothetical protein [Cetobacterium sp.]SJZ47610.1 hypothetical protein SAMN02745174_00673 [Cetobacterium ceti]
MTPKEKVRANIYKTLLEEEKKRNKKMSILSVSLFVVGIFTGGTYDLIFDGAQGFQNGALQVSALKREISGKKNNDWTIDHLYRNDSLLKGSEDFNTEKLFVSELQI